MFFFGFIDGLLAGQLNHANTIAFMGFSSNDSFLPRFQLKKVKEMGRIPQFTYFSCMKFHLPRLILILAVCTRPAISQEENKAFLFTGIVYDQEFNPVPYTNVYAKGTGRGDMTDTLGIFQIYIRQADQLSFYNISYKDTTVWVSRNSESFYIRLQPRIYALRGAKIFSWGSTYNEMKAEFKNKGIPEKVGEKLDLPQQDPDHVPFEMDEKKLKSPGFLIKSPVSFFYYNLSKREKHARRAYKLQENQESIDRFNRVLSAKNMERMTGLTGKELENFIIHLNKVMTCDYTCSEMELISEVLGIWKIYQENDDEKD